MKIALIVPGGVDRTGQERVIPVLLWTIERLAAQAEVHVFALHQEPRPGRWPLLGATIHNIGRRPVTMRALAAMVAEHRRAPFDVVHAFWASGPGVVAAAFKTLANVPGLVTLPGGDLCAFDDIRYGGWRTFIGRLRVKAALSAADVIVAQSGPIKWEAAQAGFPSQLIPFGVALDRWPRSEPGGRKPGSLLRLVHVADLNAIKDPCTLLRTVAELKSRKIAFHLDQLGFDALSGAVQRHAADLGVADRISFHGHCSREKLRSVLERAHIHVVSSRHEGGPVVALEAAIAGVPTVGTRVGQIADWAPEAALAVDVEDPEALADAVEYLGIHEDRRLRLARAAQARAIRDDADACTARQMAIYAQLVRKAAQRDPAPSAV